MKRSGGARLFVASLLVLLFIVCSSDGTEVTGDTIPKSVPSSKSENEATADLSSKGLAPPGDEKGKGEKKPAAKEEVKVGTKKEEAKETLIKKKDKSVEEPKPETRETKNEKGSANGDAYLEECDPSNRCVDEKSNFVACLRVPGKDSQDLSLLIQNKGKGPLNVSILAPGFVDLEQNTVQLKVKDNKEVKVSVKDGGNDTVIVLKAGEGNCTLNFQNMISDAIKNTEASALPGYFNHLSLSSFMLIILAAALLIGLAWSYIRFRRMKGRDGGPKYQQIDAGLPISTGGTKDANEADGWDNSWGEDWDDEEAPVTPSRPVLTPSSKGLASRKSIKDSWKD